MAAFASYRRSGWVRVLVLILCALFIFSTIGAPPAHALGVESVAVFGLASVLSAATAALGFKLASNEQGQATLQKMVQDFKTVAWATGFVLVGSKLNGLQNGMDYIKMQVLNGKTYLDERVFAWVQQWLAQNGVYAVEGVQFPSYTNGQVISFSGHSLASMQSFYSVEEFSNFSSVFSHFNLDSSGSFPFNLSKNTSSSYTSYGVTYCSWLSYDYPISVILNSVFTTLYCDAAKLYGTHYYYYVNVYNDGSTSFNSRFLVDGYQTYALKFVSDARSSVFSNVGSFSVSSGNDTGLSGTDTLGKDVIDLTLDQILQKLKEWAQDWFDAGADSATNAATGALDLPLTVSAGAATANPSIAEDGPLVWFPSFGVPVPTLRTGETDTKTVDQGKENASAVETSTVDVAENQTVIDSLVNWALSYISPDTGLFSKFPLCVPYDAYLLVTSSLGVDAVGSDSIFGASPGDLEGVVSQDIDTYSDFQPIINIKHDFELDGVTYPLDLTIDLTPWQPLVTFFREGMALLLVAELIGTEFKRIRGH